MPDTCALYLLRKLIVMGGGGGWYKNRTVDSEMDSMWTGFFVCVS